MQNPQEKSQTIFPRNPFIAALLSVLCPGLGQIYNGQFKKGIIFYVTITFVVLFVFGITRWAVTFTGYIALFSLILGIWLYLLIDIVLFMQES